MATRAKLQTKGLMETPNETKVGMETINGVKTEEQQEKNKREEERG